MSAVMEKKELVFNWQEMARYLKLYVGEADWEAHLVDKFKKLENRYGTDKAKELIKKAAACAILLPTYDRSTIKDPPQNILYWCDTWTQFNERDWVELLTEVIHRDKEIENWRNQCLSLGVVHPIEYSIVTREAFNRLYTMADESGVVTPENKKDIVRRFQNLVLAYGGNVICYLFVKEEFKIRKKVANWRTNYFFERLIFDTYSFDQVFKIKKQELAKTNQKLVKSIRVD